MVEKSQRRPARRPRFSLAALLLVALGVVLLLNTTGVVRPAIWLELFRYWPVLLILLGISVVFGRRMPLVCAGVVGLILAGTISAAYVSVWEREADDLRAVSYTAPLSDTEELQLNLEFFGGAVTISADPFDSSTDPRLLTADFNLGRTRVVEERTGKLTQINLTIEGLAFGDGDGGPIGLSDSIYSLVDLFEDQSNWDITVSKDVAVSIDVKAGAADLVLDLTDLDVEWLSIGAGASDIIVWLPSNAGMTRIVIDAGAADVDLVVPQGVAARIDNDTFVTSTRIDQARFPRTDDGYQSPGYSTAKNRVRIEIDAAAADLTVS